jgi:hypothetical protein
MAQLYRSCVCNAVFVSLFIIHSYVSSIRMRGYRLVSRLYVPHACVPWRVPPGCAQGKSEGKVPPKFQLPPGTIAAHSTGGDKD